MKKEKFDGRGAAECQGLDWVDLSESLNAQDGVITDSGNDWEHSVVNETISQIVAEDCLKVDTSDMDEVREAVKDLEITDLEQADIPVGKASSRRNVPASSKRSTQAPSRKGAQASSTKSSKAAANKSDKAVSDKKARSSRVNSDEEKAIRQSVDDKIIIRSKELKEKRESASAKSASKKSSKVSGSSKSSPKAKDEQVSFRTQKGLDKYRKMGVLPSKKNGPTQFRQDSSNWRDDDTYKAEVTDEAIQAEIDNETFFEKIKSFSAIQWTAVGMSIVVFLTSVMTTGVYADYRGTVNMANAFAGLPGYVDEESFGDVSEGAGFTDADSGFWSEDFEMPTAADGSENGNMLSLVLTSVEKDLKIKLVDENDTLVKGIQWAVTITDEEGKESSYEDEDKDGIIHLTDIKAGDYDVAINESPSLEGYVFPTIGQKVSVKSKIEYKVIANIKDEIKKESEVNAAAEDNGNKAADVETGKALEDTVEFVESSSNADGEEYEEAEVCLSNTEIIASVTGRAIAALSTMAMSFKNTFMSGLALGFNPVGVRKVADEKDNNEAINEMLRQYQEIVKEHQEEEYNARTGETPTPTPTPEAVESSCHVEGVKLSKTTMTLEVGQTASLSYTVLPEGTCADSVKWMSQDNSICSVIDGRITANAEGTTRVGVIINNKIYESCDITVTSPGESKVILTGSDSVLEGKEITIEAKCEPESDRISTWYTSNNEIASINASDNRVIVKGVSEGKVTITAQSLSGVTATFDVTVKKGDEYKDEAQLYDSSKNKLYVCENGQYRLAKYIDYKSGNFDKFYRKASDVVYTGWQVIGGTTYYFTENHEKVTGEQVIGGVSYKFDSDGALEKGSGILGMDVSKYQPSINWESVKSSGINFVIIRCGYRGASTGSLIQDPYFTSHIKGAKDAGLKVGVYFFSTALNEAEAVEEASMCAALCEGYGINYPVFLDVESSSRPGYNTLSVDQRTSNINAFCSTISSAGYTPGLYANKTWLTEKINTGSLSCKIWLAQYNSAGPTYTGHYDIWQYTSKGSVNGISGNVDMNKSYLNY